ncbi:MULTISPECIES: hypothetical protein [unclassified Caballeronia]|uniref:COG4705 family protein n=1 Tax=unclassified Caballeronia TaxID=2646786 RepID=UPI002865D78E|nr:MULTISPECIES: hypothetical protein [unclassified Caballeronia]MDR5751305.1 hypothetical protein [Caballeronia sp. LZ024]MDR5844557.1 hypothetical protein [Caballeronia sp. LZ031]
MLVSEKTTVPSGAWLSKVPQVTLMFWFVKVLATTVGETGGDSLSMTLKLGYGISTLIVLSFFAITLAIQLRAKTYHPFAYWAVVVATTTVGTTTSDYIDRTLKMGYVSSSAMLLLAVLLVLIVWRVVVGRLEFENITTKTEELFYWLTILVSNTLGTALGDFVATTTGLGFERGALVFASLLLLVAAAHFWWKRMPTSVAFWAAYVLTRPLGATLGDTLTKGHADGGLALGTIPSSLTIAGVMIAAIVVVAMRERSAPRIR